MELMSKTKTQMGDRPLILFFIISFSMAWLLGGVAIAENYGLLKFNLPVLPFLTIGSWGPNIAAFIVLGFIMKKKSRIKDLLKDWCRWNINIFWYVVAVSPVAVAFLGLGLYKVFHGSIPLSEEIVNPVALIVSLILSLVTGATGEELGWRGFALPWLQTKMNALFASIVLGVIWSLWHLPLWFAGLGFESMSFGAYMIVGVSFSVIVTWSLNNTKGSMVLASLLHMFLNFSLIIFKDEVFPYFASAFAVYAIVIVIIYGPKKLSKSSVAIPVDKNHNTWIA
ncbi:MAG: type II CAAX endopeptidase family protein [Bacillota bacterium]|nr:type II CAAX endopeptidase family protein [Bacillota bacterium]